MTVLLLNKRLATYLLILLVAAGNDVINALSLPSTSNVSTRPSDRNTDDTLSGTKASVINDTRRGALVKGISFCSTLVGVAQVSNAAADVLDLSSQVTLSAALRTLKASQKKLANAVDLVDTNDYVTLKQLLRIAPMSDLRKSSGTIIKAIVDDSENGALQKAYSNMTAALEKFDSMASLAMRGRDIGPNALRESYQSLTKAMSVLVEEAETVVGKALGSAV